MLRSPIRAQPPRAQRGADSLVLPASADVDPHIPLRLSVTRGALGIELYEPVDLGPLTVLALCVSLPGLKYPLDLSGGVRTFRHRRGALESLRLGLRLEALGRWLQPRLQELLPGLDRVPAVWGLEQGLGVGLVAGERALAFDVLWAPSESDGRLVVASARGVGLSAPALAYALRALDSALGGAGTRRGRVVEFPGLAAEIARRVLPAVGARAPAARAVRAGALSATSPDELCVDFDSGFAPAATPDVAARALTLAALVSDADDALAAGDVDRARAGYVAALEQAPRHPELSRIVAEIDVLAGGRVQAALGMVVESLPASDAGLVGAELLAASGDHDGAAAAIEAEARAELFAPLAALAWCRLAALASDARSRVAALDHAVARAPSLAIARWARLSDRLSRGEVDGALSDAEHLEAAASGARERHAWLARAARATLDAGFVREAGRLFERALRYLPDDAAATAGLARALAEAGRHDRAHSLLERAIALGEAKGRADPQTLVDLARLLATRLGDVPGAVARVRQVPVSSALAVQARGLEARWRAQLGDIAGASLAYGRLREAVELATEPGHEAVDWLLSAASFERSVQDDAHAAERHLSIALRLAPKSERVAEAYRDAAAVVAARSRRARQRRDVVSEREAASERDAVSRPDAARPDLARDAETADRLTAALRADPAATEVAVELASVLERLGRDEDLFALLSARREDADERERALLLPLQRAVLERLESRALAAGRPSEARTYADARRRLE